VGIIELITELLNAFMEKNTTYIRKCLDFKIIDLSNCKTCKTTKLDVK
jgi:hypothetical protein